MLVRALSGSGGSGGQTKSGTFTVSASSWGTEDLGFTPTKVYIGFTSTASGGYGAGFVVYDEELSRYMYVYQASSFYSLPLTNNFEITSSPKGFKIKNPWGSYGINVYYLAEG